MRIFTSIRCVSGAGAAVLLRALEPLEGLQYMQLQRQKARKAASSQTELKAQELCNGPAKLCISFSITKSSCNEQDLSAWDGMWIQEDESFVPGDVVTSHRIGVDSVGSEWASKPLRFYLLGNPSISRRDRAREKELQEMVKRFYQRQTLSWGVIFSNFVMSFSTFSQLLYLVTVSVNEFLSLKKSYKESFYDKFTLICIVTGKKK
jgi:DNA-3-methyladenine glycosylase